jgi:SOS response associated peptidase (SRAP)
MSEDPSKEHFKESPARFVRGRINRRRFIGRAARLGISAALLRGMVSSRTDAAEGNLLDSSPDYPNEAPITKERIAFLKNKPYKGETINVMVPKGPMIPADDFYEWKKVVGGKIPYAIGIKDGSPFVFAGLWEGWKESGTDEWLRTCTIITGEPNELVARIHTRMPVILPEEDQAKWLGESEDGDLKALLKPFPADQMRIWEISPRVNSPENNDPGIIDPIPDDTGDSKLAGS